MSSRRPSLTGAHFQRPEGTDAQPLHEHLLLKALKNALTAYEKGASKETIVQQFKETTKSVKYPEGISPITLMRSFRAFITEFSCSDGHDFGAQDSDCGKSGCAKKRTVRSMRIPFDTLFLLLTQDPVFSKGVQHGPSIRKYDTEQDLVTSCWESRAMDDLHQRVAQSRSDGIGLDKKSDADVPVVIELFVDGFNPLVHGSYSMWVIMAKVLNLPPEICNDYIIPIAVIDSGGKPSSLDAHLEYIVKQLQEFVGESGHSIRVPDTSRPEEHMSLRIYLLCIACDMRAMKVTAKHMEALGEFPCQLCDIQGRQFRITRDNIGGGPAETRGSGRTVYDTPAREWIQKTFESSRREADFAGYVHAKNLDRSLLRGFRDQPVWSELPYFNLAWGFPTCAMHQLSNTTKSAMRYVQKVRWTDTELQNWFGTDEGSSWLDESGFKDDTNANGKRVRDWTMGKWPRINAVTPPDGPNLQWAHQMMMSTRLPTNYNGHARDISHLTIPAGKKQDAESLYRKIKASHWKDHAISGLLLALWYGAGVDEELAEAFAGLWSGLKVLCAHAVSYKAVNKVKEDWKGVFKTLHRKLLPNEYKASLHALYHLPDQVLWYGPLPDLWSFPFEGLFTKLKPMAMLNRAMPAQTLVARFEAMMSLQHLYRCLGGEKNASISASRWTVQVAHRGDPDGINVGSPGTISLSEDIPDVDFLNLLIEYYTARGNDEIPDVLKSPPSTIRYDISEFDTLMSGNVKIQGAKSQCTKTNNRHVLVRCSEGGQPYLGFVYSIVRFQMFNNDRPLEEGNGRLLLLVGKEPLQSVPEDERLGKCGYAGSKHPGFGYVDVPGCSHHFCLIGVDEIQDQAFLVPDILHNVEPSDRRNIVLSKGSLQNITLRDPFRDQSA